MTNFLFSVLRIVTVYENRLACREIINSRKKLTHNILQIQFLLLFLQRKILKINKINNNMARILRIASHRIA